MKRKVNTATLLRNMKVMFIPIIIGALGTVYQRINKGTGRLENKKDE